ncbi:MAG TPA: hypothetical protein PK668_21005 [Myxococcota bacterium]|nr:hypothetical protein [Myxococcota bacterium]HRY95954.1 hypothetical protein [Myxococcota bacterium]HSA24354.1 hypothetical protein [Myxococcota bacterium]
MALRAFLLAGFEGGLDRDAQVAALRALETLPEVTFVEPVVGAFDLLAAVESESPVEELLPRVRQIPGVRAVQALKVQPLPARDRMWRNLKSIPHKPGA